MEEKKKAGCHQKVNDMELVRDALKEANGVKHIAAKKIGVSLKTLERYIRYNKILWPYRSRRNRNSSFGTIDMMVERGINLLETKFSDTIKLNIYI